MELQERIERLESRESIRTLVTDYSMAVDDRDVDTIGTLFAEKGVFGHADGSAGCARDPRAWSRIRSRRSAHVTPSSPRLRPGTS